MAATVNGEAITVAAYEVERRRCEMGIRNAGYDASICAAATLQSLIEQEVVEQAAGAAGLSVTDAEVDSALARVQAEQGSPAAFEAWLAASLYSPDEFRSALRAEILRMKAAQQITAAIGPAAEQVHARQILVTRDDTAAEVLAQLQAGADFAAVALNFSRDLSSRAAGGDLGWFPRGALTVPEVEAAAFSLQPGETSGLIHSALGIHVVQTLEHDPDRVLSPGAAQRLRASAFSAWLDGLLAEAEIVRLIDP